MQLGRSRRTGCRGSAPWAGRSHPQRAAGRARRRWPPGRLRCAPRHLDRRRERQPDQPVRGRLDDHERRRRRRRRRSARRRSVASVRDRAASPGRSGGSRRCRCRRPRPSRRAAPPPRAGAGAGPGRRARRGGRSRTGPARRPWRPAAVRATSAQRGASRSRPPTAVAVAPPRARTAGRTTPRRPARRAAPRWWCRPAAVRAGGRVPRPELVDAGHRHHHAPVPPGQVPRRRQLRRGRVPAATRSRSWAPVPGHRGDGAVGQPDPAQRVVDACRRPRRRSRPGSEAAAPAAR